MAIDASIALGVKPLQMPDPVNQLAKVLQIQGMQDESGMNRLKMQEYQRGIGEQDAVAKLMTDPSMYQNGRLDTTALTPKIYAAAPTKAAGVLKGLSDQRMADATYDKTQLEAVKQRTEIAGQVFGSVRANPTLETASQALDYLGTHGIFKPDEIAKYKAQLTPENVGSFADTMFRASLHAKDQLGKIETKNIGGQTVTQMTDPLTGKTQNVNTMQNTQSPDSVASNATQRATNAATNATHLLVAGLNADGTPRQMPVAADGTLDLTKVPPEDLAAAHRYRADGTLPPNMGRGAQGAAESKRIRAIATALDMQAGDSPEDARVRQLALKGDVNAIAQMRKREVQVAANVKNFDFNADQVLQLSQKVDRTGVPIVNAWLNAGRRSVQGNPDLAAFDTAVKTTVNEFAQIVGGTTSGASTEGEKKKAEALLNAQQTPEQIISVINQMRVESANRMKSFAETRKGMMPTNSSRPAAPAAAPAAAGAISGPAAGAVQDGYRFKGGNPSDPKSWEKV